MQSNISQFLNRYRSDGAYRKFVGSAFSSFLIRILGMGTGFLVTVLISRFFGAGALGIVSICMAILSFASIFSKLGMDVALMRYIAGFASKNNFSAVKSVYLTGWRFILPTAVLISALLFFTAPFFAEHVFHKPYLLQTLQLNALFVLPLTTLLINSESVRALEKIKTYAFLQTSAVSTLATILLIAAILFSPLGNTFGIYLPVYIQFISITLAAIMSLVIWLLFSHWFKTKSVSEIHSLKLIKTSSPMFVTTVLDLIMSWAGVLIMAAYYSEAETGVFNAIVRTSTFVTITIHAVNSIASPRFAAINNAGDTANLKQLSKEATRIIFISSLPCFLILFLFPHFILSVFGKDFTGYENPLRWLLVGQLFVSFSGLASQILNMTGREKIMRNIAFATAIVNVGCCFALIPFYGIRGAAIAQVAGMVTWNLLCIWNVKRELKFNTFFSFAFSR